MACYTVNLVSVEFKAKNEDILIQALNSLGWNFRKIGQAIYVGMLGGIIDLEKQSARIDETGQSRLNELKREYSKQVLLTAAQKKKWVLKQMKEQNKFQLRRY